MRPASQNAANQICDWLANQRLNGSAGEQIIEEVRREFADRELLGILPPPSAALLSD